MNSMTTVIPIMIMAELRFLVIIYTIPARTAGNISAVIKPFPVVRFFFSLIIMVAVKIMVATLAISAGCIDTPLMMIHLFAPF